MPWTARNDQSETGAQSPTTATSSSGFRLVQSWQTEFVLIVLVTAALRGYVFSQTEMIARDGMLYVGMARTINHGMWLDLVGDWFLFNPYPALMAWLNRCGMDFELAGQLISTVASTLTVVPLYFWCRSAFDRRTACLAALTYALHPVLLRFSGQVLREGLYWFCMMTAVWLWYLAASRRGWLWYGLAGLATTAATLTRMEGAVLFVLGALWTLWPLWTVWTQWPLRPRSRSVAVAVPPGVSLGPADTHARVGRVGLLRDFSGRTARLTCAVSMFPLTLIVLNLIFIPAGHGWHGCGRWVHFAVRMTTGQEIAPRATKVPDRMVYLVADEKARAASQGPPIADVRQLAKSLPAWNPLGEPVPEVLRLQRFLILADDQQRFLFIGRFINECWEGLLFPCVICCGWGLWSGRRTHWKPSRDWPLAIQAAILSGLLYYHVATEFILESRYMFCLIPFVFPWSAIGARDLFQRYAAWCADRPAIRRWQLSAPAVCVILAGCALAKLWIGLEDRSKSYQRELGTLLRNTATHRLKIAGPESLKRVGHYADADYFIIPRGKVEDARQWLDHQPLDLVLLAPDDMPVPIAAKELLPENSVRYRHWSQKDGTFGKIEIYSVNHRIRQVGS